MSYETTTDWVITDLGVQDDWVYDIEVEGCHNFFANNILVHNSVFLNLEPFHEKVIGNKDVAIQKVIDIFDSFGQKEIEPRLAKWFIELGDILNLFDKTKLHMKREKIIDRAFWRGKKNYVVQVWDNEGVRYHEPKLVPVGIEIAKSSTPEFVKSALKESLKIILNDDEKTLQDHVKKTYDDFMGRSVYELASPRGIGDLDKWVWSEDRWKLKTPFHIKGAIVYNEMLDKCGLSNKYDKIKSGAKIKYIYLKEPNPAHSNIISFDGEFHPEFGLDEFIDRESQYEKTFMMPLNSFTSIISWDPVPRNCLDSFSGVEEVNKVEFKLPEGAFEKKPKRKSKCKSKTDVAVAISENKSNTVHDLVEGPPFEIGEKETPKEPTKKLAIPAKKNAKKKAPPLTDFFK